jgi:predicted RNA-binding protein with PUA-like domain
MPNHWLFKSEAETWSWDQQVARGAKGEPWSGVRNYGARQHMRAMKLGDLGFFYHSGSEKQIVGIVRIAKEARPEPGDETGKWDCVDVIAVKPVPKPVTLEYIRSIPAFAEMVLVKNSRLSVQPVTPVEWTAICKLGGLDPAKL